MKNIFTTLMLVSCLAFSAEATSYKYVKLGGANHNIESLSSAGINFGIGVNKITQNNLFFGIDINFDYADIEDRNLASYYSDIKLGYSLFSQKLSLYAIGSALEQNYILHGYGFGYGGGVEYRAFKSLSLVCEYKTYNMTNNASNYDYDNTGIYLQYNF